MFQVQTCPGAVHSFDNPAQHSATSQGHPVGYDRAAAEDSFVRVKAFLDQYVKGG